MTTLTVGQIITENHYNRLNKILDGTKGEVVIGGGKDDKLNKIEVTVVTNVSPSDSLMEGEIFGPLLPIVTMESREEAVAFINSNENPLALYSFTGDSNNTKYLSEHTRSGSCVQNDVLVQFLIPGLPFGGSGNSGQSPPHLLTTNDDTDEEQVWVTTTARARSTRSRTRELTPPCPFTWSWVSPPAVRLARLSFRRPG